MIRGDPSHPKTKTEAREIYTCDHAHMSMLAIAGSTCMRGLQKRDNKSNHTKPTKRSIVQKTGEFPYVDFSVATPTCTNEYLDMHGDISGKAGQMKMKRHMMQTCTIMKINKHT